MASPWRGIWYGIYQEVYDMVFIKRYMIWYLSRGIWYGIYLCNGVLTIKRYMIFVCDTVFIPTVYSPWRGIWYWYVIRYLSLQCTHHEEVYDIGMWYSIYPYCGLTMKRYMILVCDTVFIPTVDSPWRGIWYWYVIQYLSLQCTHHEEVYDIGMWYGIYPYSVLTMKRYMILVCDTVFIPTVDSPWRGIWYWYVIRYLSLLWTHHEEVYDIVQFSLRQRNYELLRW